jgi:hypothetical protein
MRTRTTRFGVTLLALSAATLLGSAACDQAPHAPVAPSTTATAPEQSIIPPPPATGDRKPNYEAWELCKDYSTGSGPAVTFDVTVDDASDGDIDETFQVTLNAGECRDIWLSEAPPDIVTVTEIAPAGYTVTYTKSTLIAGTLTTTGPVQGTSASGPVSGGTGAGTLVIFLNTPTPTTGGEGCTPGYWKQEQHFDSWPTPYTPWTKFSDVFENAFPGLTLLDVLKLNGGGLQALGRHTVAALLNAASSGVGYNLTTAEVISQFNAVYPGGNYEALKNTFAGFNEQTCPLN